MMLGLHEHEGQPVELAEGMVITCEPGLYISQSSDAPARYRGIGIRIEDDVLITGRGPEVLNRKGPERTSRDRSSDARLRVQISVIGGGPIGLIARTALDQEGHEVRQFDPSTEKPKMSLALAESTLALLDRIGVQLDAGEDLTEILVNEARIAGFDAPSGIGMWDILGSWPRGRTMLF